MLNVQRMQQHVVDAQVASERSISFLIHTSRALSTFSRRSGATTGVPAARSAIRTALIVDHALRAIASTELPNDSRPAMACSTRHHDCMAPLIAGGGIDGTCGAGD